MGARTDCTSALQRYAATGAWCAASSSATRRMKAGASQSSSRYVARRPWYPYEHMVRASRLHGWDAGTARYPCEAVVMKYVPPTVGSLPAGVTCCTSSCGRSRASSRAYARGVWWSVGAFLVRSQQVSHTPSVNCPQLCAVH